MQCLWWHGSILHHCRGYHTTRHFGRVSFSFYNTLLVAAYRQTSGHCALHTGTIIPTFFIQRYCKGRHTGPHRQKVADHFQLAKASALALVSMLIILITVLTQGPRVPSDMKGKLRGSIIIHSGIFQAIGVISFAFVCHHNSLLIYGSLKKPTLDRFSRVTHFSTGISMVACLVMGLAGYLTFGDKTQGNVLNNFPSNNVMVNVARL